MNDFTHLHLHTNYSMLDGAIRIPELMKHVKEAGMSSVAITDHGNMFGVIDFYKEAIKQGVKPIIGSEFYVIPNRKKEEEIEAISDGGNYHLILLAKNEVGYKNLIKLSSLSFTEGFYRKPRIDYDLLDKYNEGLICLTACLAGEVNRKFLENKDDKAKALAHRLHEIFRKEDFYLEIQDHGIKEQEYVAKKVIEFSKESGIPLVLTNDSHFLKKDDQSAQDIMLRIATNKSVDDHMMFGFNQEFYVKNPMEMAKLFPDHLSAFQNTLLIRDKCDLNFKFGNPLLPKYDVPDGYDTDSYMEKLVWDGLRERYGDPLPSDVKERALYELKTITTMQFCGYFLIVQDFINFAKKKGIPVGPGRGSAAGSIVAYALGITNVDPIKYGLLFERFLNPDRKDMPDIDTDFCRDRREEVYNYLVQKYGETHVSQIIAYGSLAAKAALKDVARVFNLPFNDANEITKAFPKALGMDIQTAVETSKELKEISERNENYKRIFSIATRLEGNFRQPGRHAAGVVIAPYEMDSIVPLSTVADKEMQKEGKRVRVTQYDKNQLESVGLIKMDLLGLKNLTTIQHAVDMIHKRSGVLLDMDKIPLDDEKTFSLLRKANVLGIFQLDASSGIRDLFAKAQVRKFEEIAALLALYRPGPMGSGMLDDYLDRKNGKKKVAYPRPELEEVLKETYGVVVYQEQVMFISRIIGGFSVGDSDVLRKAMAKKDKTKLPPLKEKFVKGATEKGISDKFATELFEQLEKFGEYGFNKSHSVAYAFVTYQTAFLKANYPVEYFTSILATENGGATDLVKYIKNAKEMGISILTPDINESEFTFSIPSENKIRFGLSALKGVGGIATNSILNQREKLKGFKNLKEFLSNIDTFSVNKKVLEALIQVGALDTFGYSRKCLFESIDSLISFASKEAQRKSQGQENLFMGGMEEVGLVLPKQSEEWDLDEKLKREKSITGLYLSGHPLDAYKTKLDQLSILEIDQLDSKASGSRVELCGIITKVEMKLTKKKEDFMNFIIEDYSNEIACVAFPKTLQKYKEFLKENQVVFIRGNLDKIEIGDSEAKGQVLVQDVEIMNESVLIHKLEKSLHIKIDMKKFVDKAVVNLIYSILKEFKGSSVVYFHLIGDANFKKVIRAHSHYSVDISKELASRLTGLLGTESVYFTLGEEILNARSLAS
jgi:DNA polymerase-3 subunit alpha